VEGTYVFPLPEDAAVKDFSLWVDGKPVKGEVMDAEKARDTYETIVRQMKDPALLEYVGRGAVQASVLPIQPGDERRIEL
jgi:Ca-activated chloride channel family protein